MPSSEVLHQPHAHEVIRRALARGRLPHACILHGPDGVGKEQFATGLAAWLLCTGRAPAAPKACGDCEDCRAVRARIHPDLHLVHRYLYREHPDPDVKKRKGLDIGVDVIRHFVIDPVGLTPTRGRAKVFIIREADRITDQAQNALLKTLEEPPGPTYLFLLAASTEKLLATTLSRCQVVRFDPLPVEFVEEKLAELQPDLPSAQRQWYARASDGSLGAALRDLEDDLFTVNLRLLAMLPGIEPPEAHHGKASAGGPDATKAWMEVAAGLADHHHKRDPDITDTEATRRGLAALLRLAANAYADVLRTANGQGRLVVNFTSARSLEGAAAHLQPEALARAVHRLAGAERQLDLNVNTQLCLDVLLNDLNDLTRKSAA